MNFYKTGDITAIQNGIIIQQVNAQGVMGSGVAAAIRKKYPVVWEVYSNAMEPDNQRGASHMGRVITVEINPDLFIANIVGQQFFGKDGEKYTSYDALDRGLKQIARINQGKMMLHLPLIGSGLGGGSWFVIKEIIEHRFHGQEWTLWTQPSNPEPRK